MSSFDLARLWWQQADAKRWSVARIAYRLRGRKEVLLLAAAIGKGEDTVKNLSDAYLLFKLFVLLAWKRKESSESIRKLRRLYPYTRWAVVCRNMRIYEYDLDEAREWLEEFSGGNDAMDNEIQNKHGAPEWERRAGIVYRQAFKLQNDFGVPDGLQSAAVNYVKEFEKWEKRQK